MKEKKITSSKAAAATLAAQQHMPVREFLNREPVRANLLKDLPEGRERKVLKELLGSEVPITGEYTKAKHNMASATVSMAAEYISGYLTDFSKKIEPLKARRIVICIPRKVGGAHVGYHFACFNTKTKKYLDGPATKELFENVWKDEIRSKLRKKLEKEARLALSERLKGRDDYRPLDMEIGSIEEKPPQSKIDRPSYSTRPQPHDHNRVWKSFNWYSLLSPSGAFIISSDAGWGKTTFLSYLQLEILQNTNLIPILLHASKLEQWKPENTSQLAKHLAETFDLKVHEGKVIDFLKKAFEKDIILLVDGLDQIRGRGSKYECLLKNMLNLINDNLVIASRPSAVTSEEENENITFLRLRPFNKHSQKSYFGKNYKRACELAKNNHDLIAIPMLAYTVRTLIEKKQDKNIRNRAELYKRFINYVLGEYEHGEAELPPDLRTKIRQSLRRISYDGLAEEKPFIQKIPLEYCIEQDGRLTMEAEDLTKCGLVNLIIERSKGVEDFLYFTHQSFQEYLAAEWARKSEERVKHILNEMWDPKWTEVIKFLTGLLGEKFVEQIYSPRCKDNSIHSRVFLAAGCCSEFYRACELEKTIFNQLRELVFCPPFGEDAVISLSRLNTIEAIDFLVDLATSTEKYHLMTSSRRFVLCGELIFSLAQAKILPRHIDGFLTMLETSEGRHYDAFPMLAKLVEYLTDEHVGRIIDLEYSNTFDQWSQAKEWRYFAEKLSSSHIDRMFKFIVSGDKFVKFQFLRIMKEFTMTYANLVKWERRTKCNYNRSHDEVDVMSLGNLIRLLLPHIETVFNCAETGDNFVGTEACWIMVELASAGVLLPHYVDWLIKTLRTGPKEYRDIIIHNIGAISHNLPWRDLSQVLEFFLGHSDSGLQWFGLHSLYDGRDSISHEELAKLVTLLDGQHSELCGFILEVLATVDCRLASHQIDVIIDMLGTKGASGLGSVIGVLSKFVKDMKPEHVDRIFEALSGIDDDVTYTSIFSPRFGRFYRGGHVYCPVPEELIEAQIRQVGGWLNGPCRFRQKLAVELLANLGDNLPDEYREEIIGLLPQFESDVLEISLNALGRPHIVLSDSDIHKVIDCLKHRNRDIREAAAECLKNAREKLVQAHIARIVDLLGNRNTDIANNALTVLACVPENVPREAMGIIITMIDNRSDTPYQVQDDIAKFADRITTEDKARILEYVRTGTTRQKQNAMHVLCEMGEVDLGCVFYEIMKYTQCGQHDIRYAANWYLERVAHRLTKRQVAMIVKSYEKDLTNEEVYTVVCKVSPKLLANHIDLFVRLLHQQEAKVQIQILDVLALMADSIQLQHVEQVERLLCSPNNNVRIKAYELLKTTYALSGLPC